MLTKVLAGVLAAVAVTGSGVYFATSSCESGGCPIHRALYGESSTGAEQPGCCSMPKAQPCSTPEEPNESLAACMGGSTLAAAQPKPVAAITCCPVE